MCSRGFASLKTNDGNRERETRIALIPFSVFHPACNRLTARRKDQQNEDIDIEGVAALLKAQRQRVVDLTVKAERPATP